MTIRAERATPPEPQTERVPLAECLGREVLVKGERRVIQGVERLHPSHDWWAIDTAGVRWRLPVAPDGTVEVLAQDGER